MAKKKTNLSKGKGWKNFLDFFKNKNNQKVCGFLFVLFLLFAPATCNGVTYYRGIRGCSSGGKTAWDADLKTEVKHGSVFGGLINW